ncbi:protein containg methyltransferase domain [Longilinea arvoryzae]|uniref:Protein containg methyltransferase domain n=1 Tax=Longilinea arvoryzae TaxID=360412 RepID=A0A0S7BG25_9CHLR|nr:class I SAM-dependent methyltransferase [Longilinea arvoryzae]GAP12661.1 protein containg methyltransferase domain [Longilinea arvoryzae]
MEDSLCLEEIGLLLLIDRLQANHQTLGRETIVPFAELKQPAVARGYAALIGVLLEKGFVRGDAEAFALTPDGSRAVRDIAQRCSLNALFYDEYYRAIRHSRAHALFCERVYGKDLGQHGMADMQQLDRALAELQIEPGMTLLDFGCGDGQISEYIADASGALVTGVDLAGQAIRIAAERTAGKRDRIKFRCADVEKEPESLGAEMFDRVIAIDSLFFTRDQPSVTKLLLDHLTPGGRMVVFYICPPPVAENETAFARGLSALGQTYRVLDFSVQNKQHWLKKEAALKDLESMFKAEGNEFLYKNRLAECGGIQDFRRFLYVVRMLN